MTIELTAEARNQLVESLIEYYHKLFLTNDDDSLDYAFEHEINEKLKLSIGNLAKYSITGTLDIDM